jgi:DNA modification methylase
MLNIDEIHLGDNLKLLKQMEDNTVDSVVTDPPYGISFMNKKWDYDVPTVELWEEVYRVLKPGGHILVACGTRTQHRMACNIEDAGFEIRDIVAWVYGSGFPKSMDISKAIDKHLGAEREVIGDSTDRRNDGTTYGLGLSGKLTSNESSTDEAKQWQGWGTALKPAMELFTLARKPFKSTVAENVLEWGVGGLNIDGCRIGTEERTYDLTMTGGNFETTNGGKNVKSGETTVVGRFPANFIHDGSEEVVALFPNTEPSKSGYRGLQTVGQHGGYGENEPNIKDGTNTIRGVDDNGGSASRFFYTSKASQSERNDGLWGFEEVHPSEITGRKVGSAGAQNGGYAGMTETARRNIHPTVKPLDLMRYLCRLITPKDGIVLEPFAGSGTTCIAAKQEKMHYIGMEIEPKYVDIAKARIKAAIVEYDIFDFLGE